MPKFVKNPVVIEAVQYDGTDESFSAISELIGEDTTWSIDYSVTPVPVYIHTLEGKMRADIGDWIIKGIKGEFYPCKPDIFESTYTRWL